MKRALVTLLALGALVAGTTACRSTVTESPQRADFDSALVNAYTDSGIHNAIIAQHTFFPYHFFANSERLNELGQRDLDVLAAHYREYPGPVNVRRGDAPPALYDARVREVSRLLVKGGVPQDRLTVTDALPGGSGMASEQIVLVNGRNDRPGAQAQNTYIVTSPTMKTGASQ